MTRLDRMRRDYERFTKAEGYIIGFPVGDMVLNLIKSLVDIQKYKKNVQEWVAHTDFISM